MYNARQHSHTKRTAIKNESWHWTMSLFDWLGGDFYCNSHHLYLYCKACELKLKGTSRHGGYVIWIKHEEGVWNSHSTLKIPAIMFHLKITSLTKKNRQQWMWKEKKKHTSSRENRVQTAAVIVLSVIWNTTRMYSMRFPSIINEKEISWKCME